MNMQGLVQNKFKRDSKVGLAQSALSSRSRRGRGLEQMIEKWISYFVIHKM